MSLVNRLARALELLLEAVAALLMVGLTVIVLYAVLMRTLGSSPSWYDEVASIMLAWLTYYAGALAALKRAHIGFDGVVMALPVGWRMAAGILGEVLVVAFFVLLAWMGWVVLQVLTGMSLVSLTWVPVQLTQSVIPIGASLFVLAQLLSAPAYLAKLRAGVSVEREEIAHQIEAAEAEASLQGSGLASEERRP